VGANVGVDSGGLEKTGTQLLGEVSFGAPGSKLGVGASLDDTGCLKVPPKAQLGPIIFKPDKLGWDVDVEGGPKIGAGLKEKLAGRGCIQGKF
jgi:hypothetical protein